MTKRTQAILGLTGVFLLGGICGALLFGVIMRDHAREAHNLRNREGFLRYFENKLSLTESQRDSIREELDRTYHDLDQLREQTTEQYNALLDTLVVRVMPVLNEEQRTLFQTQEQKFRRFMPGRRERRPGGMRGERPPGPGTPPPPAPSGMRDSARVNESAMRAITPSRRDLELKEKIATLPPIMTRKADTATIAPSSPQLSARDEKMLAKLQKRAELVRDRLKLSDDQAAAFQNVLARTRQQVRNLQEEYAGQPDTRRQKVGETLQGMDREIIEILDENQRQTWSTLRQEMAHKRGKKRRKNPEAGGS